MTHRLSWVVTPVLLALLACKSSKTEVGREHFIDARTRPEKPWLRRPRHSGECRQGASGRAGASSATRAS
jgi:hypothetical protein